MNTAKAIRELTNEQLIERAPSVGAIEPFSSTSNIYSFVPTTNAVDYLRDAGWLPVDVKETNARSGKLGFQKHMIRFARPDLDWGERRPELLLQNSHDGASSFQLDAGVFRFICSNGMVVMDGYGLHYKHRHVGFTPDLFVQNAQEIALGVEAVGNVLENWESIELTPNEQGIYAMAAHQLLYEEHEKAPIKAERLLVDRRKEDRQPDLWHTFNRVQENVIKGGLPGWNQNNRRTRTRAIKSIDRDKKLNQALWTLTEEMAKLKQPCNN